MKRFLPLLLALASLAGCATRNPSREADSRAALTQVFSTEASLTYALGEICMPAAINGIEPAQLAHSPRAMAVDPRDVGGRRGNEAWFVGSGVYVVHTRGLRGCSIYVRGGDGEELRRIAIERLSAAGFRPGRSGTVLNGALLRNDLCLSDEHDFPVGAIVTNRLAPAHTFLLTVDVFVVQPWLIRRQCDRNGLGEGRDRPYEQNAAAA